MAVDKCCCIWELMVVVYDELQVRHGLIPLVCNGCMLSSMRLVGLVDLVNHVWYVTEVCVQPASVLHRLFSNF